MAHLVSVNNRSHFIFLLLCCSFPLPNLLQIQDRLSVFTSYDQFLRRHFSVSGSLVGPLYLLRCDWLAEGKAVDLSPCAFLVSLKCFTCGSAPLCQKSCWVQCISKRTLQSLPFAFRVKQAAAVGKNSKTRNLYL